MIPEENNLHNIYLIKRVVEANFGQLKNNYQYTDCKIENSKSTYGTIYECIQKNELIICVFISTREAYEVFFLKKGNEVWQRRAFNSFYFNLYKPLSEDDKIYLKALHEGSLIYEKYSFDWYNYFIQSEIKFMIEHYPKIINAGQM